MIELTDYSDGDAQNNDENYTQALHSGSFFFATTPVFHIDHLLAATFRKIEIFSNTNRISVALINAYHKWNNTLRWNYGDFILFIDLCSQLCNLLRGEQRITWGAHFNSVAIQPVCNLILEVQLLR